MMQVATKKNISKYKKIWDFFYGNTSFTIITVMVLIIAIVYCNVLYNNHSKVLNQIGFIGVLIGLFMGVTVTILVFLNYEDKSMADKSKKVIISYSKIIKADLERTKKLFKDKKFNLLKINQVTIIENWTNILSSISSELDYKEIQQYINYYTEINKLDDYRKDINKHLSDMENTSLKEYPHMKEYNTLLNNFSKELVKLFKTDITLLNIRINSLIESEK